MKIAIIGLGLIGGSLALDFKAQGHFIIGISRQENTCLTAIKRKIVDRASTNIDLVGEAEIVFICTPIGSIASVLKTAIPYLKPEAIVTDVGSVKEPIVKECSQLWDNFIGGHPMAGTAEQGINAVQSDLFKNAVYVITPNSKSIDSSGKDKLENLVISIGAKPYICSPTVHDRAVALISHLPVMVSTSLISTCLAQGDREVLDSAKYLASSGFRDTSRVGGGNPELGTMMAKYNKDAILASLFAYRENLDGIIELIEQENWHNLEKILEKNQKSRPEFLNE